MSKRVLMLFSFSCTFPFFISLKCVNHSSDANDPILNDSEKSSQPQQPPQANPTPNHKFEFDNVEIIYIEQPTSSSKKPYQKNDWTYTSTIALTSTEWVTVFDIEKKKFRPAYNDVFKDKLHEFICLCTISPSHLYISKNKKETCTILYRCTNRNCTMQYKLKSVGNILFSLYRSGRSGH